MGQTIVQVDAFTREPFRGNPAAVCLLERDGDSKWMQCVAAEMNLAETAYIVPKDSDYGLRWFTPTVEVDLCGHATLASAHVLWEDGHVSPEDACRFHTRSGLLTARKQGGWIELQFPLEANEVIPPPSGLADALGAQPITTAVSDRLSFLIAEVESEDIVRGLAPDIRSLKQFSYGGYIITSRSGGNPYDVVSRFFAPRMGIDEDPVTGAAHCVLGPYWSERLNKRDFFAHQASARGGDVRVGMREDHVTLGGQAVTVMRAELV